MGGTSGTGGTGGTGGSTGLAACGNDVLEGGEECDLTSGSVLCTSQCQLAETAAIVDSPTTDRRRLQRKLGYGRHTVAARDSEFAVAVQQIDQLTGLGSVRVERFTSAGVRLAAADVSTGASPATDSDPVVAYLPGGDVAVAFTEFSGDGDELGIALRRVSSSSNSVTSTGFANAATQFSQYDPDILGLSDGIVVAWADASDPQTSPNLHYRVFSADLSPRTATDTVLAASSGAEGRVALAPLGSSWGAAWRAGRSDGLETIEVEDVGAGVHFSVGPHLPGPTHDTPSLIQLDDHRRIILYSAGVDRDSSGIANGSALYGAVLDVLAPDATTAFALPTTADYAPWVDQDQFSPIMIREDDGAAVVGWATAAILGDSLQEESWVERISASVVETDLVIALGGEHPLPRWPEHRLGDQRTPGFAWMPASARYPQGALASAWTDYGAANLGDGTAQPDVVVQLAPWGSRDVQCTTGQTSCIGDVPQSCSAEGRWVPETPCGGHTPHCRDGACHHNAAGTSECVDANDERVLTATQTWESHRCTFGCENSECVTPSALSCGNFHSCAIVEGTVRCWGYNYYGQLGNNTTVNSDTPVPVLDLSGVTSVTAANYYSCAVTAGAVECWGRPTDGGLGNGELTPIRTVPVSVLNLNGSMVDVQGRAHACATNRDGLAQCWGLNGDGQLGNQAPSTNESLPVSVLGLSGVASTSPGGNHTCALLTNGTAQCWGRGVSGQLGRNALVNSPTPGPVLANASGAPLTGIVSLQSGSHTPCALLTNGTVKCWGWNSAGQLGNGVDLNLRSLPTFVVRDAITEAPLTGVKQLGVGPSSACAVLVDGTVECWGTNDYGQLGNGKSGWHEYSTLPVTVLQDYAGTPLTGVDEVEVGSYHACASSGGTVRCWGYGASLQIGKSRGATVATELSASCTPGQKICIGTTPSTCNASATWVNGTACTGDLPNCRNGECVRQPCQPGAAQNTNGSIQVCNADGYWEAPGCPFGHDSGGACKKPSALVCGSFHNCVIVDGAVRCWGYDGYGQLGDGRLSSVPSPLPAITTGISAATDVSAGGYHTCAVEAGLVKCWGMNNAGQLGGFTTDASRVAPVIAQNVSNAVHVNSGSSGSCAVLQDQTMKCWGPDDYGQLGDQQSGTGLVHAIPVTAIGLGNLLSSAMGQVQNCSLFANGTTDCWGYGYQGQLGRNAWTQSVIPQLVWANSSGTPLTGIAAISSATWHLCARMSDGTAKCWGSNSYGQIGDGITVTPGGTTYNRSLPTTVRADASGNPLTGVQQIATGLYFSCALVSPSGTVKCWGSNWNGQLGNGKSGYVEWSSLPVTVVTDSAGTPLSGIQFLGASNLHACAVDTNGQAWCWGRGINGEAGLSGGSTIARTISTPCTPGELICDGSTPRSCDATSTWIAGTTCAGSTPNCRNGACVAN